MQLLSSPSSITIVDYGVGNIGSIVNMLKRIDITCHVASTVESLKKAEKILLPGLGSFDHGMISLDKSGLRSILEEKVLHDKTPVLGICLGAQMLGHSSEEGTQKGLGWIPMDTLRFKDESIRIPHMGWNTIHPLHHHELFFNKNEEWRFYFVHSYHMVVNNKKYCLSKTLYGHEFTSMVFNDHIVGAQFHPEKSHRFGMRILYNFASCTF